MLRESEKRLASMGVKWPNCTREEIPTFANTNVRQEIGKSKPWDFNFQLLLQFRDREGHLRVPTHYVENGHKVGAWISQQRTNKRLGTLCSEDERRLNEIGFIWNVMEAQFDTMIAALAQFRQREGYACNISRNHIEQLDGVKLKLGTWLMNRRNRERRGKVDDDVAKEEKKRARLESLGVNQRREEITEETFDRKFDLLLVFKEREGHVRVPTRHKESANGNLGAWLKKQRTLQRRGLLELDRQKWLEVAGVTWDNLNCHKTTRGVNDAPA
jgi:hypothetical protein